MNVRDEGHNIFEADKGSGCSGGSLEAGEEGTKDFGVRESADWTGASENDRPGSRRRKRNRDSVAPIGRNAAKDARSHKQEQQKRTATVKRITPSMKIKSTDARVRTAILADTTMLLDCGNFVSSETAEDIKDCLELMRMY